MDILYHLYLEYLQRYGYNYNKVQFVDLLLILVHPGLYF